MPERRMTKEQRHREARQVAEATGVGAVGAAGLVGGYASRVKANVVGQRANTDGRMYEAHWKRGAQFAQAYRHERVKELKHAAANTRPEDQKVDSRVVGGSQAVVRHKPPKFRYDLVPHGEETRKLGEQASEQLKSANHHLATAKRGIKSAKRMDRGGKAAMYGGLAVTGASGLLYPKSQGGLRKSADPFEVSKANPFKAAARAARGSVMRGPAHRARSGGWMLKPKARLTSTTVPGGEPIVIRTGGGLTGGGKLAVAGAAGVGAGVLAAGHKKVYRRRNDTKTVKVKVHKRGGALVMGNSQGKGGMLADAKSTKQAFAPMARARYRLRLAEPGTNVSGLQKGLTVSDISKADAVPAIEGGMAAWKKATRGGEDFVGAAKATGAPKAKKGLGLTTPAGKLTGRGKVAVGTAAGLGAAGGGYAAHKIGKGADPFEISKLGGPKATATAFTYHHHDRNTGVSRNFGPSQAKSQYKGKSLILRRPKYHVTLDNPKARKKSVKMAENGHRGVVVGRLDTRLWPKDAKAVHTAHKTGAKKVTIDGMRFDHKVAKSYTADPFELSVVSKKKKTGHPSLLHSDASAGRRVTTHFFAPVHGLVAGKHGHKWRAAGNEYLGGLGGGLAGGAAGAAAGVGLEAATKGKVHGGPAIVGAQLGSAGGAIAGRQMGLNRAQNMGHYKPERRVKKSFGGLEVAESAFGDEISKAGIPGLGRVMTGLGTMGRGVKTALSGGAAAKQMSAGAKIAGSGMKQLPGAATLRSTGTKIAGLSPAKKIGLAAATGAATTAGAVGTKRAFGKAYSPSGGGKLKALSQATHADTLAGSFGSQGKPALAARAGAVRDSALARSGGKTVRAMRRAAVIKSAYPNPFGVEG